MAKTKLNLPAILDREIPDLPIPEPIDSTGFMRRTHIECITNKDVEEELTVGSVYRVEDTADDGAFVMNDNGNVQQYYNWHFISVEHGPFKAGDQVELLNHEDVVILDRPKEKHVNIPDYIHSKFIVIEGNKTDTKIGAGSITFGTP